MSRAKRLPDNNPLPFQFSLRSALLLNTVVGIILSIPLIGVGFAATFGVLATLCALQLPLFLLFGAFRLRADAPQESADESGL